MRVVLIEDIELSVVIVGRRYVFIKVDGSELSDGYEERLGSL